MRPPCARHPYGGPLPTDGYCLLCAGEEQAARDRAKRPIIFSSRRGRPRKRQGNLIEVDFPESSGGDTITEDEREVVIALQRAAGGML